MGMTAPAPPFAEAPPRLNPVRRFGRTRPVASSASPERFRGDNAVRRSFPCRSYARSPSRPGHIGVGCHMTEEKQKTGLDLTRADSLNRRRLLLP